MQNYIVAFWDNGLGERGTSVNMYNYALYNEKILKNRSIILYNNNHYSNRLDVIKTFQKKFVVIGVDQWSDVDPILEDHSVDVLYVTKAGDNEGQYSTRVKTIIHCVFNCNSPHGDLYTCISGHVSTDHEKYPVLPYIVDLPDHDRNMRKELNIPDDAVVFGRHGGFMQFDIKYVLKYVQDIADKYPNIYFLFVNTHQFCPSKKNIIFLPAIIDLNEKVRFINTCDAMLWARHGGETFGLSIAEFSIRNKPVFATGDLDICCGAIAHVGFLKDNAYWYDETNLYDMLVNFDPVSARKKDWNMYRDYTPEKVMNIFQNMLQKLKKLE
jgi:hypothetical protein